MQRYGLAKATLLGVIISSVATIAIAQEPRGVGCWVKEPIRKNKVYKAKPVNPKPYRVVRFKISSTIVDKWKFACTINDATYMSVIIWEKPVFPTYVPLTTVNLTPIVKENPILLERPYIEQPYLHPIDVAAIPEPSTWAMMLIGFGVVGILIRRKKCYKHLEIR